MQRRRTRFATLAVLSLATSTPALAQVFTTDASTAGMAFNPGVRGQSAPATPINRSDYPTGVNGAYAVSDGSTIRGVAGGLEADTFNWKTRNYDPAAQSNYYGPRAGTLDYLRAARDHNADLYITANIRGLVRTNSTDPANLTQEFYDTSIPTLASLAADWVRYTNRIVPTYRQGQAITDPRDQAILNSLQWSSSVPGDNFDKLLRSNEGATPKVKYWEIGNEPRVGLASSYKVTNSYTFYASSRAPDATHKTDFNARYKAITSAMLAEDPTIKVGPAMQWLNAITEKEILTELLQPQTDGTRLPVNFIGYHPYQTLAAQTSNTAKETYLRGIYNDHLSKVNGIKSLISAAGRDPNSIALVASEHNVSNHTSNGTVNEANMAHALGNTETVFSFARLGLQGAHYWLYPTDQWDGTKYPIQLANEKLRDHMGDAILASSADAADNLHLYTTKTSETGEIAQWGLNFSNATDITRSVPITNAGGRGKVTLYRLGNPTGATTLDSSIIPSYWTGGPVNGVAWTTTDLTGTRLDNLSVLFKASTITLLTIDEWRQISLPGDVNGDGTVNGTDTAAINSNNGQNEKNWWQGDVTGDGLVNAADAALVAANQGVAVGANKWKLATGGTWTTGSNWVSNSSPNGTTATAYFGNSATGPITVTTASNVSLSQLVIDNPNAHVLAGASGAGITLTGGTTTSIAKVFVVQGAHTIAAPLALARSTTVDVAGGSALTIAASSIAAGKTLTQSGGGRITINGTQTHGSGAILTNAAGTLDLFTNAGGASLSPVLTLNVSGVTTFNTQQNLAALNVSAGGLAKIAAATGSSQRTLKTVALTVAPGGKLDLANRKLVVDYAAGGSSAVGTWDGTKYTGVTGLIASGFHAGLWDGSGIVTSSATSGLMTLGIADASTILGLSGTATKTWGGQTVDASSALVTFTYVGDADLNGSTTLDDFTLFLNGYQNNRSGWVAGDFDYNGRVTLDDFTLFLAGYQNQGAPLSAIESMIETMPLTGAERWAMLAAVQAVPEPKAFAFFGLLATRLLRRHGVRGRTM
jgi:hypothetical protein